MNANVVFFQIAFMGLQYSYSFWLIEKYQIYKTLWTEWNNKCNTIITIESLENNY